MTTRPAVRVSAAAVAWALGAGGVAAQPGPTSKVRVAARADAQKAPGPPGPGPVATTHGLSIPPTHPRLWFDAARLARAKAWYRDNRFSPRDDDHLGQATRGLLAGEPARCRAAFEWALATSRAMRVDGVACDACRWNGEQIILAYDWCHAYTTPSERVAFITATNAWIDHWRRQAWGGVPQHHNNYYWGYLRNELEWAITSYEDNVAMAEKFLDDVFTRRLAQDFDPSTSTSSRGGVALEGSQYGPYITYYATVPFVTAGLLGRDVLTETSFWREAVYAFVYSTTPAPTAQASPGGTGYKFFPFSDDEQWVHTSLQTAGGGNVKANFMTAAAMRWSGVAVGKHARQWLNTTGAPADPYVRSVDTGGPALPFKTLPLDYYASGAKYLWGRNVWGPSSTVFMLQLGDGPGSGHEHVDWGTWQIWRNGRFLSRETVAYGDLITGPGGSGTVSASLAPGHNSVLVNGAGIRRDPWSAGAAMVRRLESRPAYAYAAVDLSATSNDPHFVHLEREFVFVRALETMVILDRIESRAAADTKTFVAHCEARPTTSASGATCTNGPQALVVTTLLPASRAYRVIHEEKPHVGQYRIEVDTSPGTARSYILTVLQAKGSEDASLSPSVVERDRSWVLTLDGTHAITFEKGMVSSGGALTIGQSTARFTDGLQTMTVTDEGPAWK